MNKAKERKKAKEAAAAERGGKDKDGAAATVEKANGEAEGSVAGEGVAAVTATGPKKGAKKMAKKEGDGAKSKKRKADGGFWLFCLEGVEKM